MLNRVLCAVAFAAAVLVVHASDVQTITLDVRGMDCAACPLTVKTVLKRQPGVNDVKMDAEKHTAEVIFDPAKVTPDKLAKAVTETGYPTTQRR